MGWPSRAIGVILLCVAATQAYAAAVTFPERGRNAVVDAAGVIPDRAEAALEARLVAWNRSTGYQLVVATVPSLQGREIQDYGTGLLRHWRLGRAGANDGIILLLAPNERQVRIEVGYGLEPVLTDARSSLIIREAVRPPLRAGDVAGALTAGAEGIMRAVASGAEATVQAPPRDESRPVSWWWIILGGLGCVILGIFLYPLFELWFAVWPFYLLMPARAKRAEQRHEANRAKARPRPDPRSGPVTGGPTNNLSTVRTMAAAMRARLDKQKARSRHARPPGGSDALEALRDRAQGSDGSGTHDSYDSGGSSDPGFDSGGGSGGGGGADSNY
jgi:uncharacterized membrane protein YgcG